MEGSTVTDEFAKESRTVGQGPPQPAALGPAPFASGMVGGLKKKSTPARFITPLQGLIVKEDDRVVFECVIDGEELTIKVDIV